MSWRCGSCDDIDLADDVAACPACGALKASWTMVADQTRQFVLSRRGFEVLRGVERESRPQDEPRDAPPALEPADAAYVLRKAEARALAQQGHLPPTRCTTYVRLFPRKGKDLAVRVDVEYAQAEVGEVELPFEGEPAPGPAGEVDVPVVCVAGPEPSEDLRFAGLHVLDVSEADAENGHAPAIAVRALKKPAVKLPLRLPSAQLLSARLLDRSGRVPQANVPFVVEGSSGQSDEQGLARLEGVSPGYVLVQLGEHEVHVPSVHTDELVVEVCLPWVEVDRDELDRRAADEDALWWTTQRELEPREPEPLPAWFPGDPEDEASDDDPDGVEFDPETMCDHDDEHGGEDEADDELLLSARFLDRSGRIPQPDLAFTVGGADGRTDAEGYACVPEQPAGYVAVAFADREVLVPTTPHQAMVVEVCLPWAEADPAELARRAADEDALWWATQAEPEEPDGEALPAWFPAEPDEPPPPDDPEGAEFDPDSMSDHDDLSGGEDDDEDDDEPGEELE